MKKNKLLFQSENRKFKEFLIESNYLLIVTYLLFLSVQTSVPSYNLKIKYEIIDVYDKLYAKYI